MKKLLIVLLLISGCTFTDKQLEKCKKLCEPNNGIGALSLVLGERECICHNGAKFSEYILNRENG